MHTFIRCILLVFLIACTPQEGELVEGEDQAQSKATTEESQDSTVRQQEKLLKLIVPQKRYEDIFNVSIGVICDDDFIFSVNETLVSNIECPEEGQVDLSYSIVDLPNGKYKLTVSNDEKSRSAVIERAANFIVTSETSNIELTKENPFLSISGKCDPSKGVSLVFGNNAPVGIDCSDEGLFSYSKDYSGAENTTTLVKLIQDGFNDIDFYIQVSIFEYLITSPSNFSDFYHTNASEVFTLKGKCDPRLGSVSVTILPHVPSAATSINTSRTNSQWVNNGKLLISGVQCGADGSFSKAIPEMANLNDSSSYNVSISISPNIGTNPSAMYASNNFHTINVRLLSDQVPFRLDHFDLSKPYVNGFNGQHIYSGDCDSTQGDIEMFGTSEAGIPNVNVPCNADRFSYTLNVGSSVNVSHYAWFRQNGKSHIYNVQYFDSSELITNSEIVAKGRKSLTSNYETFMSSTRNEKVAYPYLVMRGYLRPTSSTVLPATHAMSAQIFYSNDCTGDSPTGVLSGNEVISDIGISLPMSAIGKEVDLSLRYKFFFDSDWTCVTSSKKINLVRAIIGHYKVNSSNSKYFKVMYSLLAGSDNDKFTDLSPYTSDANEEADFVFGLFGTKVLYTVRKSDGNIELYSQDVTDNSISNLSDANKGASEYLRVYQSSDNVIHSFRVGARYAVSRVYNDTRNDILFIYDHLNGNTELIENVDGYYFNVNQEKFYYSIDNKLFTLDVNGSSVATFSGNITDNSTFKFSGIQSDKIYAYHFDGNNYLARIIDLNSLSISNESIVTETRFNGTPVICGDYIYGTGRLNNSSTASTLIRYNMSEKTIGQAPLTGDVDTGVAEPISKILLTNDGFLLYAFRDDYNHASESGTKVTTMNCSTEATTTAPKNFEKPSQDYLNGRGFQITSIYSGAFILGGSFGTDPGSAFSQFENFSSNYLSSGSTLWVPAGSTLLQYWY